MLDSTVTARTQDVLDRLNAALEEGDIKAATALFTTDSYWRDLVAVTWNLKTVEGQDAVGEMLLHQLDKTQPNTFRLQDGELPVEEDGVTTAWVTFETKAGRGWGLMRLKDDRIWTLLTALQELKGFEENRGKARPMGAEHGAQKNRLSWKERREAEEASL
ncbi:MAG: nuclear transport factor 2 family protein, partial [Alphaproteobacteria bacterium]|nr:nuclear transport factor 2 family protein [Alphaproteobacteria bacterium]MBU1575362.1 nuclear transport factor 2 family protein [Alphaproteobacteria bacterium]